MGSKILQIQGKKRPHSLSIAGLQDFDYVERESIESKTVVDNPEVSLYCLDFENRNAIFVETPSNIDLCEASFLHQAQYEHAQRLIAVPFEDLYRLAADLEGSIQQLVIIYSVGRCGSTLLSKIFDRVETVLSLSEPDVFSQLAAIKEPDGSNDREIRQLLKVCIYFLGKPTLGKQPSHLIVKLRSFGIELADLIYEIFPDAKTLFLYRNLENVVQSSIPAFVFLSKILESIEQNIDIYSRFMPLLKNYADDIDFTDSSAVDLYTTLWLSTMDRYLNLYRQGIIAFAIRYEDLVVQPQQIVTAIFEYCGLPVSEVDRACQAFKKDAHNTSGLSNKNYNTVEVEIPSILEIRQKTSKLLAKHPEIKTSDFVVPGTVKII